MPLETLKKDFTIIYERENDALFRFCFWRVTNREVAIDLTGEAFARLWVRMVEGGAVPNPRAFLYLVLRRLIIDWYRKAKPLSLESLSVEDEQAFDPVDERALEELETGPEARRVLALLNKLGKEHQEIIYLRFIEELPPREIARILNISPNAASIRLTRGLEALRRASGIEKLE